MTIILKKMLLLVVAVVMGPVKNVLSFYILNSEEKVAFFRKTMTQ